MKFTVAFLMYLVAELASVDARVLSTTLGRRDGYDLGDDLVFDLMARDEVDFDQFAMLFARGPPAKKTAPAKPAAKAAVQKPATPAAKPAANAAGTKANSAAPKGVSGAGGPTKKAGKGACLVKRSDGRLYRRMCEDGTNPPNGPNHNQEQETRNQAQQQNNVHQQGLNTAQQTHNAQQATHNGNQLNHNGAQNQHNVNQNGHNIAQNQHNAAQNTNNGQQATNNLQQQAHNAEQRLDNGNQAKHNNAQLGSNTRQETNNQGQSRHNEDQLTHNNLQQDKNAQQLRDNTRTIDHSETQQRSNAAQKDSNTKQEQDNALTRQRIDKSKPTLYDKCFDGFGQACAAVGGATALYSAKKLSENTEDHAALSDAVIASAVTVGALALPAVKEPLRWVGNKCIGAACYVGRTVRNQFGGGQAQPQAPPQNPPSNVVPGPHNVRRAIVESLLVKRGVPEEYIPGLVQRDSERYFRRSLGSLSKRAEMMDDLIWM